jgi:hypothetical protein
VHGWAGTGPRQAKAARPWEVSITTECALMGSKLNHRAIRVDQIDRPLGQAGLQVRRAQPPCTLLAPAGIRRSGREVVGEAAGAAVRPRTIVHALPVSVSTLTGRQTQLAAC